MKTTFEPSPPISLYFDEDVAETIAVALRLRGYDVVTVKEAGRKGYSDRDQLHYAVRCEGALFTHNIADFCRLHAEFMRHGETHTGIVVSKQLPVGIIVHALGHFLSTFTKETMANQLIWLSGKHPSHARKK